MADPLTEDLVTANVNCAVVGMNWPRGIAQLIEAHEKKHVYMVKRKQIHILLERYRDRYFPGELITWGVRRQVIQLIQSRFFDRFNTHLAAVARRSLYKTEKECDRVIHG